ncbi:MULTISPECIES: DUF6647 family protein [Rhodobacterales]
MIKAAPVQCQDRRAASARFHIDTSVRQFNQHERPSLPTILSWGGLQAKVNWIAVILESGCSRRDFHPD